MLAEKMTAILQLVAQEEENGFSDESTLPAGSPARVSSRRISGGASANGSPSTSTSTSQAITGLVTQCLDARKRNEPGVPVTALFTLERLRDIWGGYGSEDVGTREHIVRQTRRLLQKLQEDLQFAPVPPPAAAIPATVARAQPPAPQPAPTPSLFPQALVPQPPAANSRPRRNTELPSVPPAPAAQPLPTAMEPALPSRPIKRSEGPLDRDITFLKGVGPQRAKLLAKWGINTVGDLLYHFPTRHEDRQNVRQIGDLRVGEKEAFACTVLFGGETRKMGHRNLTKVKVGDGSGRADLQWWNQPFREKQFKPGMKLFVYGKVSEFNGYLQIDSPEFEIISEEDGEQTGKIVPVYPATEGLYQSNLRRMISNALGECGDLVQEMIPESVRLQHGLMDLREALREIHFPTALEKRDRARYRLVFEELFLLQVALTQRRYAAHLEEYGIRHIVPDEEIKAFVARLPFKLTGAQKRVMNEVRKDLRSPRPMNRLLHGDVGSGKTIVATYALWTACQTGHQGALLAPTEILAEQHFTVLKRILEPMGISVGLLEGSISSRNKRRIQADIAEGRLQVIIGTHALIQETIEFHRLGVCVVDEQHRFGVMQRAALANKGVGGTRPDILVMTATPIPRTMALTVYGDLEVSVLDELPPGRQPIVTKHLKSAQRERAYGYVLSEIKKGRQAYVVCPLVEESEKLHQLKAATALAEHLRANELRDVRVGLVHGQMSVIERDEEMDLFRAGMRDVLVSTTVIEVGVDVPNATIMVVEDADRFGLSQLHQLRGRIGRGEHKSMCILMGDPKTDEGKARLSVMTKTQNGFEIAEYDLQLRGPGEFYGTRQSGLPDFRLADIVKDIDVIQLAREAAQEVIQLDPHLAGEESEPLLAALHRFWGEKLRLVQVS